MVIVVDRKGGEGGGGEDEEVDGEEGDVWGMRID